MKTVLLDSRLFMAGLDLSGFGNKIELAEEAEAKKITNWRSGGAEENIAGLTDTDLDAEGQLDWGGADRPDDGFWSQRRQVVPMSASPNGESDLTVGTLMYLTRVLTLNRTIQGGSVGDVAEWSIKAKGNWPLARGIAVHPSGTPRTATGSGTAVQVGAVPAGRYLYANLHVLSVAGTSTPTITVTVQSDDANGFPSATARGSFAARTTVGGESIRIPGSITDNWWRVGWTITGGSPSFLFLVTLGIE